MGMLSWWKGGPSSPPPAPGAAAPNAPASGRGGKPDGAPAAAEEVPGLHGAVEVPRRPADVTVFEFGSAAASGDRVTVAGYCPVSDDLEPCRWEILPAAGDDAPQFRIVF
ncbi:uncharacterized protein LOC109709710 [Ananas comosus]|uniref:Uncharacterized protein LOC109709710 n=1 Tax=Ananas comosus TaxID=4615 RepID=A0A6P5EV17_ANACO|nr:uncharacterized protein LOC109709710 [Ananas comosus]